VQFDIFCQGNRGAGAADDVADAIIAKFKPGVSLARLVWITQAQRTRALIQPDWIQVPVSVYWRAFRSLQ
jgi:hypothetical protein